MFEATIVKVSQLHDAPWRFSEKFIKKEGIRTDILNNIKTSLETEGQLRPILGFLHEDGVRILDGHVVVDAARDLGWDELFVTLVEPLDDVAGALRYINLNLNRAGQYHVKIRRLLGELVRKNGVNKTELYKRITWDAGRVEAYIELDERGENWQNFMFAVNKDKLQNASQMSAFPDMFDEPQETDECQ